MKTLTVFTPTYNRKHTLPRTYESLCRQTSKDFDWLVIDDGSSDGTREWIMSLGQVCELSEVEGELKSFDWMGRVVDGKQIGASESFQVIVTLPSSSSTSSTSPSTSSTPSSTPLSTLKITYIYKPNGGLYTGYNVAYQTIQTELCVCIDSDDFMPDDAVRLIVEKWKKLNEVERKKYCGIRGLDYNVVDGKPIGGYFPESNRVGWALELNHTGDTKYVFRTELMRQVAPQIGFEGERDFNPHFMQMQVLDQFPIMLLNDNLCWVEYQIGGDSMSQGIFKQYVRSPRSYVQYRLMEMQMKHGMTWKRKLMLHMHFVSACLLSKNKKWVQNSPNKLLSILALPFGLVWTIYVKAQAK